MLAEFLCREVEIQAKFGVTDYFSFNTTSNIDRHKKPEHVNAAEIYDLLEQSSQTSETGSCIETSFTTAENSLKNSSKQICTYCKGFHALVNCNKFLALTVHNKWHFVKENKLCQKCLKRGSHNYNTCRTKGLCNKAGCTHKHHKLLHNPNFINSAANIQVSEESSRPMSHAGNGNAEQSPSELVTQTSSVSTTTSCRPLLKVVAVTVSGPAGSVDTFALLDDGSTATFIDSEITSQIGVTGTVEQIELQCVGGLSKQSQVEYVDFQIKGKRSADSFVIKQARSISNLGLANRNVNKSDVLAFPYLLDIADELCYNAKPTIIIGIDNWNLSVPMAVRQGTSSQPVAILTVLGWVLFGFVANRTNAVHFVNNVCDYDLGSDKLRVVNNAVAKLGVSSNKLPLREPDFLKSFLNIVNRFYEESVIINDDIKAIYPQVKIHNVYCDAQRFTWRDSSKEPLKTYLMSSMIYGAASSPFTDLLINNKSRYKFPRVTHVIFHDHYIDNYITSRYRVC
ncbi:uncharacterized protein LOC131848537 [Achroia grisella]|uniref:uncharacterized protein LOC131848537 n=1 Tax=Achroia grisella TaxID=688607 RepID=UPI0027D238B0|nr:uncharacterized protein LOC131848537 [Achroia grisella]